MDKLQKGFAAVGPEDTVVLCGDLSWGMSLEESLETSGSSTLPGKKYLLKATTTTGGTPPPRWSGSSGSMS
mgnify:CR=1 FL=1